MEEGEVVLRGLEVSVNRHFGGGDVQRRQDVHCHHGAHRHFNLAGDNAAKQLVEHRYTVLAEGYGTVHVHALVESEHTGGPLPALARLALETDFFADAVDALLLFQGIGVGR